MDRIILLALFAVPLFSGGLALSQCPDVTPCDCSLDQDLVSYNINCYGNSLENGTHLQTIFSQDFSRIRISSIYLKSIDFRLPAKVLGSKTAELLSLDCSVNSDPVSVLIDPAAFRDVSVLKFSLGSCRLADSSYDFLGSFRTVRTIEMRKVLSETYPEHPPIPKIPTLENLWIDSSSIAIWQPWHNTPRLSNVGITGLSQDKALTLFDSFSRYKLETLFLGYNSLRQVPAFSKRQSQLTELYLNWNEIQILEKGALTFDKSPALLELGGNRITEIEPEAFLGDFSGTRIVLSYTFLKSISEAVFRPLLEQMYQAPGTIDFEGVRLRCDCDIAWIVRDNRHFLDDLVDAKCSNGTRIDSLDPAGFSHCPGTATTTTTSTTTSTTTISTTTTSTTTTRTTTVSHETTTPSAAAGLISSVMVSCISVLIVGVF